MIALLLCLLPSTPWAQSSASGSVGGAVIGDDAAAVASAELDSVVSENLALGIALRLRMVDGGPLASDWDELSDVGRVLRYLVWKRSLADSVSFSLAAGHLGNVRLGHGSLALGYASGLDFDRGRAGAELRAVIGDGTGHIFIDDLTRGEIVGGRFASAVTSSEALVLGVTAAHDRIAAITLVGVDAEVVGSREWFVGALYSDLAAAIGIGAGVHLGARIEAARDEAHGIEVRGEVRFSSSGYVPGWISPMYLRDRDQLGDHMDAPTLAEHARAKTGGGGSWLGQIRGRTALGNAEATLATRPGLPWQASGRFGLPSYRAIQLAAWMVFEKDGAAALACELRITLPRSLFLRGELARQYTRLDERWTPQWLAGASLGAVLGE